MTSTRSTRTVARLLLTLVLGVLGLIAAAAPATAAPRAGAAQAAAAAGCPANSVCLYNDKDYQGHVFTLAAGDAIPSLHAFACAGCDSPKHGAGDGNFGDQMSAWVNNTSWSYCWYYDINYGSYVGTMPAGQAVSWVGKRAQDEASSIRPC
jgi:hypothetical protein